MDLAEAGVIDAGSDPSLALEALDNHKFSGIGVRHLEGDAAPSWSSSAR